jgi:putative transposase
MAAGFATARWTLRRIAALIEREFGVHYHPHYLERPLKAHGFSVQHPATRAKERDELVIAVWPKRDWVVLKRRPSGRAARSFFGTRQATASAPGQAPPGRGAGSPRSSSA